MLCARINSDMRYRPSWELDTIPGDIFYAEVSRRRGVKGGRPAVQKTCPNCAEKMSAREMRKHRCSAQSGKRNGPKMVRA